MSCPDPPCCLNKKEINDLPLRSWTGAVLVVSEKNNLAEIIPILQEEKILGFDTETRPAFRKGQYFPPSLLQMSTADIVFIFQLHRLGLPESVRKILTDKKIIKAGVSLGYDIRELKKKLIFLHGGLSNWLTWQKHSVLKTKDYAACVVHCLVLEFQNLQKPVTGAENSLAMPRFVTQPQMPG